MGDTVGCIRDERCPYRTHIFPACHLLFLPDTASLIDLRGRVAQQCEWQGVFVGKFRMARHRVLANAYNLVAFCRNFGIAVTQRTGLCRASGGIVLGIKVYHQLHAAKVRCVHFVAVAPYAEEIWNHVSYV